MGNRRGHTAGTGDVARGRSMRPRMRAHKAFEAQPGTRKPVALTALTPAACRSAPLPPAVTAQAALDCQHHLADMVGALQLGMRAGRVLEREGLVDDGLDLARLEQRPDFLLQTVRHAALVCQALWPERRAGERQ